MFIYNLEIKNFKCLDNYNIPLQFDNLKNIISNVKNIKVIQT
jgi:hypothetical protein